MKLTIFHKTGELYRNTEFGKEYDGDAGYDTEIEIDDSEARGLLADFILDDHDYIKLSENEREKCKKVLIAILYDTILDSVRETYYDRLCEYYQGYYESG